ncbi:hypothetical protein HUA78_01275 [Myxococcus sp. CA033]|uniref:hypothetical protein n=1 Tax=Myxococcus sp. CA033 TaxID=2741516 RepID=UPI00157AC1CF|nr:hypothetical protein [Myxococcus sp. CA033]NTX33059.1 hypothetical protein [Myxococcus sp. CA033]
MSSRRLSHPWSLAVVLTFALAAPPALAESVEEELVSREDSSSQDSLLTCGPARCGGDWNCEANCPEAATAVCVDFYCVYTYPDPGGGGGGGGPGSQCTGYRCGGDWNCVCEGLQGTCGANGMCVF